MKHTLVCVLVVCCSCMQVQSGQRAGIPGAGVDPEMGGSSGMPRSPSRSPGTGSTQICRNQTMPRDWIAVDYVASPSCPAVSGGAELGPNSMLLTRYALLPAGSVLTVCADQRIPTHWEREASDPADAASGQCPRLPGDTRSGPTTLRIRRVR
jgi:hypothetical protein